jgi:di/tricarboxylate transporter
MTQESYLVLSIFAVAVGLFYSGRVGLDAAALFSMLLLVVFGLLSPDQALQGFSSEAVILMATSYFLSGALRLSGLGDRFGKYMAHMSKGSEARAVALTVTIGALISSVMSNVAATAAMLPAVASLARHARISPGKLFIPLSFGVLLGGTVTLIGTSSNMLGAEVLRQNNLRSFSLLEFFPLGILLSCTGILYFVFIGRHLLVGKSLTERLTGTALAEVYRLKERLFCLQLPHISKLHGKMLKDLKWGEVLDLEVLAINRQHKLRFSLSAEDVLHNDDTLLVRGRSHELQTMLRISNAEMQTLEQTLSDEEAAALTARRIVVTRKNNSRGKKIKEIAFRATYGFYILSIEREGTLITEAMSEQQLLEGDSAVCIGMAANLPLLEATFEGESVALHDLSREIVFALKIPADSRLSHVAIRDSGLSELIDLTVISIKRHGHVLSSVTGDEFIEAGDTIVVAGQSKVLDALTALTEIDIKEDTTEFDFDASDLLLQEVVLSPRSKLINRTIEAVRFTKVYGVKVLGIWRNGEPKRTKFSRTPLQFGDALLLQGSHENLALLARDTDFVFLSDQFQTPTRPEKAKWAIFALCCLVLLSGLHLFSPGISALIATAIVVFSGAIRMDEAYREVDWRLIVMLACLLPFQHVFSHYGITTAIASQITLLTNNHGHLYLIALPVLASCVLAQLLDSTLAVIVVGPIAVQLALSHGILPQPMVMAVSVAASLGFLSPFSHRAHMLVLGPGGYVLKDFFKVGIWLTIATLFITIGYTALGL